MRLLGAIADAGLTATLEAVLDEYVEDPAARRQVCEVVDKYGVRSSEALLVIGNLTRTKAIKPRLMPKLAAIQDCLGGTQKPVPAQPNKTASPRTISRAGINLTAKRGPGDPVLLRLGTDYPVPIDKLWPREHTQTRKIHEYLLQHRVTSAELIQLGTTNGWTKAAVRKVWTLLRSQAVVRAGWFLDVGDDGRAKLVQLDANFDFRKGKVI